MQLLYLFSLIYFNMNPLSYVSVSISLIYFLILEYHKYMCLFIDEDYSLSAKVLQHIEWNDSTGMTQELRLYQILGPDWEKVADFVGLPSHVTRTIKKDNRDAEYCIRSVTEKWIEDAPRLNDYKCTLNGMCRLLIDIGQGAASKHLWQAMEADVSSLKKNFQLGKHIYSIPMLFIPLPSLNLQILSSLLYKITEPTQVQCFLTYPD